MSLWSSALLRIFSLLAALCLLGTSANAQTGKIAGRVIDEATGESLPGVNVVIVGTTQGSTTDVDGYYSILGVRPNTYEVRASFVGFTPVVMSDIRVRIDQTTEVDFQLQEEVFEGEELVVTAERPLVQRDLTSSSVSVSAEELEALPVLNFSDVINLQAGVVDGHFRGGRAGEVSYMVDGISINDVFDQTFAYQVENNAIQEVQIISGTFNAEYGQAQSGVVNIVTKDGGREFEGTLSAFGGDYLTSGTDLFQRTGKVSPADLYDVQGTLSGPILKDRLTFFASGRHVYDNGYLYGRRVVEPESNREGEGEIVVIDGREVVVPALGDSAFVPMNWGKQTTGQLKLTTRLFGANRLS
ncbi:MAG: TonB-dependent receptor, partial [Rhodothermales bacterium]